LGIQAECSAGVNWPAALARLVLKRIDFLHDHAHGVYS
jgi:hypothetical protein